MDDPDYTRAVTETLQPRAKTLAEMAEMANFYYEDVEYEPKAAKKFLKGILAPIMEDLGTRLANLSTFSEEALEHKAPERQRAVCSEWVRVLRN